MTEQECNKCGKLSTKGEMVYECGFICQECIDSAENITGYCSMSCQLFGACDESC